MSPRALATLRASARPSLLEGVPTPAASGPPAIRRNVVVRRACSSHPHAGRSASRRAAPVGPRRRYDRRHRVGPGPVSSGAREHRDRVGIRRRGRPRRRAVPPSRPAAPHPRARDHHRVAVRTLVEGRAFLEGPRWHDGALWVSDMHAQEVLRVAPDGTVDVVAHVPGDPSGLGFWADGSVLIVSMRDRLLLRMEGPGAPEMLADCSDLAPFEINDLVVDDTRVTRSSASSASTSMAVPSSSGPRCSASIPTARRARSATGSGWRTGSSSPPTGRRSSSPRARARTSSRSTSRPTGRSRRTAECGPTPEYPDGICIDSEDGYGSPARSRGPLTAGARGRRSSRRHRVPGAPHDRLRDRR